MGTDSLDEGKNQLSDVFSHEKVSDTKAINHLNNIEPSTTERLSTEKISEANVYYYDDEDYEHYEDFEVPNNHGCNFIYELDKDSMEDKSENKSRHAT